MKDWLTTTQKHDYCQRNHGHTIMTVKAKHDYLLGVGMLYLTLSKCSQKYISKDKFYKLALYFLQNLVDSIQLMLLLEDATIVHRRITFFDLK